MIGLSYQFTPTIHSHAIDPNYYIPHGLSELVQVGESVRHFGVGACSRDVNDDHELPVELSGEQIRRASRWPGNDLLMAEKEILIILKIKKCYL